MVSWACAWDKKRGDPLHSCEAESKLFCGCWAWGHGGHLGVESLWWMSGAACPAFTSPCMHFKSNCRAQSGEVCATLWDRKLSFSFFWESYQPEKLIRTPTLIVLTSNEICHAWEKGMIPDIASAWDSRGPEASCRAAAVRAAAVRRGRTANLLIFKLTPTLMGFWFNLGTALKFLATKVYRTSHLLKFVLTSLPGWSRIYSDISSVI